jgi:hypothetical protein
LIAFLEDVSHFIMQHRLRPDKRAEICAGVLPKTFQMWASPCVLGSDNGDEFTHDVFTSLPREHALTPWRNTPLTAEQNGKMEYFWGTFERVRAQNCTA